MDGGSIPKIREVPNVPPLGPGIDPDKLKHLAELMSQIVSTALSAVREKLGMKKKIFPGT
jgi:hypothetical protein